MQDLQNNTTLPDGLAGTRVLVVDGATSTGAAADPRLGVVEEFDDIRPGCP